MAVPALRAVRRLRLEAFLLPRISVTPVRANNGGKGSSQTEISKTLVSFPVKFSHFQDSTTGENINPPEPFEPLHAPVPDAGSVSGQSEGDAQLGHKVSQQEIQNVDKELPQEEDSSSSSSDSESEEEEDHPRHSKKTDGDGKSLPTFHPYHSHTHGEWPTTQELKEMMAQKRQHSRSERSEDLVDTAPSVATEEQLTVVGGKSLDRGEQEKSADNESLPGGLSSKDDLESDRTQILSSEICEEPTKKIDQEPSVSCEHSTGSGRSEDLVDNAPSVATEEQLTVVGGKSLDGGEREKSGDNESLPGGLSSKDGLESDGTQILSSGICEEPTKKIDQEPSVSCEHSTGSGRSEDLVDTAPSVATEEQLTVVGGKSLDGGEREKSGDNESLPGGLSSKDGLESDATQILSSGICEEPTKKIDQESAVSLSPPAPPAAPVPEEPYDNSKYQNEQHFSYTPLTFVDYDVELAKFRLPQPSSGRPSPRH